MTFEHEIFARREVLTNARISRIRKDLVWEDVLRDYFARKRSLGTLPPSILSLPFLLSSPSPPLPLLSSPLHLSFTFPALINYAGSIRVFAQKPREFWKMRNGKNIRIFFEEFAKKRGLDPRLPSTWYSLSRRDFEGTMVPLLFSLSLS